MLDMPRKASIDAPGALHHIIVRGINRRKIFFDDADRDGFLDRLGGILSDSKTACFAWAFMTNHLKNAVTVSGCPSSGHFGASVALDVQDEALGSWQHTR